MANYTHYLETGKSQVWVAETAATAAYDLDSYKFEPVLSTEQVLGEIELHRKTLSQENKNKEKVSKLPPSLAF